MRKVKQIGFLSVNKQRPKPKRKLTKITYKTFRQRVKSYLYWQEVKTINADEIMLEIFNTKPRQSYSCDIYFSKNLVRIDTQVDQSSDSKMVMANDDSCWSYSRGNYEYLVLMDKRKNRAFLFRKSDKRITGEHKIWEMSDLNFFS